MLALVAKEKACQILTSLPKQFLRDSPIYRLPLGVKLGMCPSSNLVSMCNLFGHSSRPISQHVSAKQLMNLDNIIYRTLHA